MQKHHKFKEKPAVFTDEHIKRFVAQAFRESKIRTIEIGRNPRLKGRDEIDYISADLYRSNGIFVTNDGEFIQKVLEKNPKHAGIIYMANLDDEDQLFFAQFCAGYITGATRSSAFNLRNTIIYPKDDGLHQIEKGKDSLVFSWNELENV